MTRLDRYKKLTFNLKHHGWSPEAEPKRFALKEQDLLFDEEWVSTYHTDQELLSFLCCGEKEAQWDPVQVMDLDTGTTYKIELTYKLSKE